MAANARTKKVIASKQYIKIRQDLMDQLERNGTIGEYFIDLVSDYMDMWVTKSLLVEDVQHRGVNIKYDNGGGQKGLKKNDSIELSLKVYKQMLELLYKIGIEPSNGGDPDADEDM